MVKRFHIKATNFLLYRGFSIKIFRWEKGLLSDYISEYNTKFCCGFRSGSFGIRNNYWRVQAISSMFIESMFFWYVPGFFIYNFNIFWNILICMWFIVKSIINIIYWRKWWGRGTSAPLIIFWFPRSGNERNFSKFGGK